MITIASRSSSLLIGIGLICGGIGLLGTLLVLRAALEEFSLTMTGIMMSAYFLGFIIGTFLCPRMIRVFGHIRAFSAFAAVMAAAAVSHGLLIDPWFWIVLRILTGLCMVGLYMVIESWLTTIAPRNERGRFLAVYTMTTLMTMALGQYLILVDEISGYRLFSITTLLIALAVVPIALTPITQPVPVTAPSIHLKKLFLLSPLGVTGSLVSGINTGAFWGMGALFAQRVGMTESGIALFMSLTVVGGILLQWPIGLFSDRYDRRHVLVTVSLANAAFAVFAWIATDISLLLLIAVSMGYGGFTFSLYAISVAHVNDHLEPEYILESSRNMLLVYGAGAVIGPTIASIFMQQVGPGSLMLFLATTLILLGMLGLYRLRYASNIPFEEQMDYAPMVRTSPVAFELDTRLDEEEAIESWHSSNKSGLM